MTDDNAGVLKLSTALTELNNSLILYNTMNYSNCLLLTLMQILGQSTSIFILAGPKIMNNVGSDHS